MSLPGLRALLPIVASLLAISFVAIDYVVMSKRIENNEANSILGNLKFTATQFQGSVNRALRSKDKVTVKQLLLDLNYLPMMQEAYLIDEKHRIIYATQLSKVNKPFSGLAIAGDVDLQKTTEFKNDQLFTIESRDMAYAVYPIEGPIGDGGGSATLRPTSWALVIVYEYAYQMNNLKSQILRSALESGSLILGVVLLMSLFFHLFVSRRLGYMLNAINAYSNDDKTIRLNISGNDELAKIGRAVDRLIRSVEEKQDSLESSQIELESLNTELSFQKLALDEHSIVSMTDHRGAIIYANDKFCNISGYSRDELLGSTHRLINSGEHDRDYFVNLWSTISSGKVWQGQIKNKSKDGSFYWVESTIVPTRDSVTNKYRYIAIRTDITAEKTLSQSLLALQKRNRQMYGVVAHELRTPVSAIEMMTHHNTQEWLEDKEQVAQAASDLLHSIDDMKMLVNPELKREIHWGDISVNQLNKSINTMVASAVALNNMEYKQTTRLPSPLKELCFTTDAYRLKACVTNLIRNACLHSEGSRVECITDSFVDSDGNTILRWIISDNGKGISTEVQRVMFQPFERGMTQSEGTGLGLHVAQKWVEDLGGSLSFRALMPGSEFTLSLPIRHASDLVAPKYDAALVDDIEQQVKGLKVLFVEDDNLIQMVTIKLLGPLFAAFDLAKDGEEGLEMAKGGYDLILTDYFMPNMTGVEMTKKLRQDGYVGPIISVTAATIGSESQDLRDAGVDVVLAKPLGKTALLNAISGLVKEGRLLLREQNQSA